MKLAPYLRSPGLRRLLRSDHPPVRISSAAGHRRIPARGPNPYLPATGWLRNFMLYSTKVPAIRYPFGVESIRAFGAILRGLSGWRKSPYVFTVRNDRLERGGVFALGRAWLLVLEEALAKRFPAMAAYLVLHLVSTAAAPGRALRCSSQPGYGLFTAFTSSATSPSTSPAPCCSLHLP